MCSKNSSLSSSLAATNNNLAKTPWATSKANLTYAKVANVCVISFNSPTENNLTANTWNTIATFDNSDYIPTAEQYGTLMYGANANTALAVRISRTGQIQIYPSVASVPYIFGSLVYLSK